MIVIFAGAGASMAVSETFPTTREFMENLPSHAKNKAFELVHQFYRDKVGNDGTVDVETILWGYRDLLAWLEKATDSGTIIGWLMADNRFAGISDQLKRTQQTANGLNNVRNLVNTSHDHINRQVYDLYGKRPDPALLAGNWSLLLKWLAGSSRPVDIFTTNYDLVIETALQAAGHDMAEATGRITDGLSMKLDQDAWRKRMNPGRGDGFFLTKLHGSVDWERDMDGISITMARFSGDHDRHSIIYPGFKGEPTEEPFTLFHDYLRNRVRTANAIVFIGYAFRDDFINQVLRDKNANAEVIVIDPGLAREDIPFTGRQGKTPVIIKAGFDEKSIHACLKRLKPLIS